LINSKSREKEPSSKWPVFLWEALFGVMIKQEQINFCYGNNLGAHRDADLGTGRLFDPKKHSATGYYVAKIGQLVFDEK